MAGVGIVALHYGVRAEGCGLFVEKLEVIINK